MIAEPGVLSTSPWNSDLLLKDFSSDVIKSYLNTNDGLDFGFPLFDVEMRGSRGDLKQDFSPSSSCSPSSTSSECSDEISLDFVFPSCDNVLHMPDHDYLNTSLNLLDDDSMAVCPSDFDWVVGDNLIISGSLNEDSGCEEAPSIPVVSIPKQKRSNPIDPVMDNKLWSRMPLEEQLEVVENLTNIISTQMGLREQLDIIRIIEPSAIISPTDTEFVIDLRALNDEKLSRVREYVKKVLASQAESRDSKRSPGKSGFHPTNAKCNTSPAAKSSTSSNSAKSKNSKQKEVKERRTPQKVFRQRQKKEHRQLLKERRSGLFVREEVLALRTCPYVEDETDIDILG